MGTEASEGRAAQGSGRRKEIPTLPAGFEGDSSSSRFLPGARLARSGRQVLTRPGPHHYHTTSTSQRLPAGGRGQRHSGGPHTPPGMRPPPLPKDQSVGGGSGRQAKPGRLVITPHAD